MKQYPTRQDMMISIQDLKTFVLDNDLKNGKLVPNPSGGLLFYSGGFSLVFPIDIASNRYALRCWIGDIGDSKNRYHHIRQYMQKKPSDYFVDFDYIEDGIIANGSRWPIVKMDWVKGQNLKDFVKQNINKSTDIDALAEKFRLLVEYMHAQGIAHGDLQHGNIIVKPDGNLVLIDYDSLFVPGLEQFEDKVKGYPAYQHPKRNANLFINAKNDYFSELVIFLSLKILSQKPELWTKYNLVQKENQLYFSSEDYLKFTQSDTYQDALGINEEIDIYLKELNRFTQKNNIQMLSPLEDVIALLKPRINYFKLEKIGQDSFLSWKVFGVDTVEIDDLKGLELVGKLKISDLSLSKEFKLKGLKKSTGEEISKLLTVKVARIIEFSSNEHIVYDGRKIKLRWNIEDANSIIINDSNQHQVSSKGELEIIVNKRQNVRVTAKGDINTISQVLPLHFIKTPQIEVIQVPQLPMAALEINLNSNVHLPDSRKMFNQYFKMKETIQPILINPLMTNSQILPKQLASKINGSTSLESKDYLNQKNPILELKNRFVEKITKKLNT